MILLSFFKKSSVGTLPVLAIHKVDLNRITEGKTPIEWAIHFNRKDWTNGLLEEGVEEVEVTVVAATGYTTREVTQLVNTAIFDKPFDIISIQIGVNNQYRGESLAQFGEELEDLFETIASNYYLKDARTVKHLIIHYKSLL